MKVYIVTGFDGVCGVFGTQEKADAFIAELEAPQGDALGPSGFVAQEWTVDAEDLD